MTSAAASVPIALMLLALGCGEAAAAGAYGVAARGQGDYAAYCAPCHGPRGRGDGQLARMLVPKPARHSDAALMNALSDAYLVRLLKEGGPALGKSPLMAAWGRILSDEQIRDLVAYLRFLARQGEETNASERTGKSRDAAAIGRSI